MPIFICSTFLFHIFVSVAAAQQKSAPVTLKVVRFPFLSYGPIFITDEEDFYAEQGIQIEFITMKEATAIQALASGNIDVWAGIFTVGSLNAMVRGGDIRLVADKDHFAPGGCPSFGLVAQKRLAEMETWEICNFSGVVNSMCSWALLRSIF